MHALGLFAGQAPVAIEQSQAQQNLAALLRELLGSHGGPLTTEALQQRVTEFAQRLLLEAIREWPGSCGPSAWEALPHLQRLLGLARDLGLPVVHITGLEDSGMVGWGEAAHGGVGRGNKPRPRGRYDIVPEVAPIEGEVVLRKTAPSAFNGTPLVAHLKYLGVDSLIVGGESTSGCVRASVVDACSYRFKVTVVEECVFDRHQAAHAMNLFDMHQKYADVLPLAEVEAHLRQASGINGRGSVSSSRHQYTAI
jgi:maleamate amidohydrolase